MIKLIDLITDSKYKQESIEELERILLAGNNSLEKAQNLYTFLHKE